MKRRRTIYFNDTRHFYLYALEPPLSMEELWLPVDEVAGTSVDTFALAVEGGSGLFYPTRAGDRFTDRQEVGSYTWRAVKILEDLDKRGIDLLAALIDRAHSRGLDFFASLRMHGHQTMEPAIQVRNGGIGLGDEGVRDHLLGVIRELLTNYDTEGIELDLAAPGGTAFHFPVDQGPEYAPLLTEYLAGIAAIARSRKGKPALLGVRVYPTEAMNHRHGMDVHTWLAEGIVDWVMPMFYPYFVLDCDMPIEWLTAAAADAGVSVYARLQPWIRDDSTGALDRVHADSETLRGAACNFLHKGCDGIYAHSMSWPLGALERGVLTELGHPEVMAGRSKRYLLRRRQEEAAALGYDAALPFEIAKTGPDAGRAVALYVADDLPDAGDRIERMTLTIGARNTVAADTFDLRVNGAPGGGEPVSIRPRDPLTPYDGLTRQWVIDPQLFRRGANNLELALASRPTDLAGTVSIEEIELFVEYKLYVPG